MVGGELGDELAVADAGRRGQPALLADSAADVLGDRPRAAEAVPVLGDVEIGLVEAQRLDQIGIVGEDRADLPADLAIDVEPRLDEDQVGTRPLGRDRRHRRPHAERARLVARRRDYPAMPAADRHRLAPQRRIVALFDRRVEGVHVDMDDLAGRAFRLGQSRISVLHCASSRLGRVSRPRRVIISAVLPKVAQKCACRRDFATLATVRSLPMRDQSA